MISAAPQSTNICWDVKDGCLAWAVWGLLKAAGRVVKAPEVWIKAKNATKRAKDFIFFCNGLSWLLLRKRKTMMRYFFLTH